MAGLRTLFFSVGSGESSQVWQVWYSSTSSSLRLTFWTEEQGVSVVSFGSNRYLAAELSRSIENLESSLYSRYWSLWLGVSRMVAISRTSETEFTSELLGVSSIIVEHSRIAILGIRDYGMRCISMSD